MEKSPICRSCLTCEAWDGAKDSPRGHCRRRAPASIRNDNENWPVTGSGDWCMEHVDRKPIVHYTAPSGGAGAIRRSR